MGEKLFTCFCVLASHGLKENLLEVTCSQLNRVQILSQPFIFSVLIICPHNYLIIIQSGSGVMNQLLTPTSMVTNIYLDKWQVFAFPNNVFVSH